MRDPRYRNPDRNETGELFWAWDHTVYDPETGDLFYGPDEQPEDDDEGDDEGPFYEPDPDAQLEEYHWRLSSL